MYNSKYIFITAGGPVQCNDGDLRLVNGDQSEGRVEICFNNLWGTICDDFWDILDARVACRQLGFADAVRPTRFASFGQGTGPIYLDNLMCVGNESRLQDCRHNGVGTHNCFHFEDAGVECSSKIHNNIRLTKCIFLFQFRYEYWSIPSKAC